MESICFNITYEWEPFTYEGKHLAFSELAKLKRKLKQKCSHNGASVYKWEGKMTDGPHKGETGTLIGETDDL